MDKNIFLKKKLIMGLPWCSKKDSSWRTNKNIFFVLYKEAAICKGLILCLTLLKC